jgi:Fe2+ or Zn2+ uptake regulation protein
VRGAWRAHDPLRRRVLELVWDSHAPIGAYAIMDLLREADDRAAAPPTVYRALEFCWTRGWCIRSRASTPSSAATGRRSGISRSS